MDARIEQVQLELSEWKKRFRDLENEKAALFTAMAEEIEKSKSSAKCETDMVIKENEDMKKKIQKLEQSPPDYARRTPILQLKSKQAQNTRLKELKTMAQEALQFVNLLGLDLDCLKLKEKDGSMTFSVTFQHTEKKNSPSQSISFCSDIPSPPKSVVPISPPFPGTPPPGSSTPENSSKQDSARYAALSDDARATVESLGSR